MVAAEAGAPHPVRCGPLSLQPGIQFFVFVLLFGLFFVVIFGSLVRCSPLYDVSVFVYSCSLVRCGPLSLQAGIQVSF